MENLKYFLLGCLGAFFFLAALLIVSIAWSKSIPFFLSVRRTIVFGLLNLIQRIQSFIGTKSTTPSQSMELDWSDLETLSSELPQPPAQDVQHSSKEMSISQDKKPKKKKKE
jgi:hypothetical protein